MAKNIYLTPHFTLEEMTHTGVKLGYLDRQRQTQPGEQVTENLTRVCQWLEMLRQRWNERYGEGDDPIVINSGYRCIKPTAAAQPPWRQRYESGRKH